MRYVIAVVVLASTVGFPQLVNQSATHNTVPREHLSHLRHGINISAWFGQVSDPKGYTKEHFQTHTTIDDIALIKAMGFDHVRLVIDPKPMLLAGHADEIPADYLGYLDAAVKMIIDEGLAVIIDIHPTTEFKSDLAKNDDLVEQFADFWRALAHHYS